MNDVLAVLQSPLQLLSFAEACQQLDIGRAELVYESAGFEADDRQILDLAEQLGIFAEIHCVPFDQPDPWFEQHYALVQHCALHPFTAVFIGHVHQWMRDFLLGREQVEIYLLDDGMETLFNYQLTQASGLNLDYRTINWRYHREQPLREHAGLDRRLEQPLNYFSFLELDNPRWIRNQWQRLRSSAKRVTRTSQSTVHYFLGQGGWVHKQVVDREKYIQTVLGYAEKSELCYVPHRWDDGELIEAIAGAGVSVKVINQPWELFAAALPHDFKVSSFTSTALLTSLYLDHCHGSEFLDIRPVNSTAGQVNRQSMDLAYDYLYMCPDVASI